MYRVDLYARVRRACRVEGMSTREASPVFGLDRKTVRKMLSFSVPPGYRRLTHHVNILEMNGDSYRLNQSRRRQTPTAN